MSAVCFTIVENRRLMFSIDIGLDLLDDEDEVSLGLNPLRNDTDSVITRQRRPVIRS